MKKLLLYFSVLLISGVMFSACIPQSDDDSTTEPFSSPVAEEVTNSDDQEKLLEVNQVEDEDEVDYVLDMGNYYYSEEIMEAEAGTILRVKIVNIKGKHDLVIDELDFHSSHLAEGEEEILEIVIPEDASSQEYEFYCSVGSHRVKGMVGVLKIK